MHMHKQYWYCWMNFQETKWLKLYFKIAASLTRPLLCKFSAFLNILLPRASTAVYPLQDIKFKFRVYLIIFLIYFLLINFSTTFTMDFKLSLLLTECNFRTEVCIRTRVRIRRIKTFFAMVYLSMVLIIQQYFKNHSLLLDPRLSSRQWAKDAIDIHISL